MRVQIRAMIKFDFGPVIYLGFMSLQFFFGSCLALNLVMEAFGFYFIGLFVHHFCFTARV